MYILKTVLGDNKMEAYECTERLGAENQVALCPVLKKSKHPTLLLLTDTRIEPVSIVYIQKKYVLNLFASF